MVRICPFIALTFIAMYVIGCSTLGKQLHGLNESTIKITQTVIPKWDKRCLEAAETCAAECKKENAASSQPVIDAVGCKASCDPYQKCKKARAGFYTAVNAIHTSVNYAIAFLHSGDEKSAKDILAKVQGALAKVYRLAQDAGFSLK
jgi:hypothetical protein